MEANTENTNPVSPVNDEFIHKDAATTNMIFGIVSLILSMLPFLSIGGIVFGAIAISRSKKNKAFALEKGIKEQGMNVAGYVTGIVGTVVSSAATLLYLFLLIALVLFAVGFVASGAPSALGDAIGSAIDSAAQSIPMG